MFVLGSDPSLQRQQGRRSGSLSRSSANLPYLSTHATIGRNSQFYNLSTEDREQLGGIEYRSLKLLLKIVVGEYAPLIAFAVCG